MKRVIRSASYEYTDFIDTDIPEAIDAFMSTSDAALNYDIVKDACEAFWDDYKKFPNPNSVDSLDIIYDEDKGRFYTKYRPFADRCKELAKTINPSGYGRGDYAALKIRDGLRNVEYNFPYGWKQNVHASSISAASELTRTQKLINRIIEEINIWIEDSYIDDDANLYNWSELLDACDLTSAEARDLIIEALDSDIWDAINNHRPADHSLQFDDDGEFEDENGNFLKYGQVMRLVKRELVNRGILEKAN